MSSPRALLSGVQNFAIHSQDVETIRTSLRLELAANIVEDHKAVSDRLGLASVPTHLVDACYDQLLIDEEKNIVKLQNVVYQAERKDLLVKDNSFETHMYKPLVCLLTCSMYFSDLLDDCRSESSSTSRPLEGPNRKDGGSILKRT